MKQLLMLAVAALPWLPAFAQSAADDCARARDPVRCEARQAALKICADKRGAEKSACLAAIHGGHVRFEAGAKPAEVRSRAERQGNLQGQDRQCTQNLHARSTAAEKTEAQAAPAGDPGLNKSRSVPGSGPGQAIPAHAGIRDSRTP